MDHLDTDQGSLYDTSRAGAKQFAGDVWKEFADSFKTEPYWRQTHSVGTVAATGGLIMADAVPRGLIPTVPFMRTMAGGIGIAAGADLTSIAMQRAVGDSLGAGVHDFLAPGFVDKFAASASWAGMLGSALPWHARAAIIGASWLGGKAAGSTFEYLLNKARGTNCT